MSKIWEQKLQNLGTKLTKIQKIKITKIWEQKLQKTALGTNITKIQEQKLQKFQKPRNKNFKNLGTKV
jgi:hypothetical protein